MVQPREEVTRADRAPVIGAPNPVENSTFTTVSGFSEYRIGVGDLLEATIFVGPEPVIVRARVKPDGSIFLALFDMGRVEVAHSSPTQVGETLMTRLREFAPSAYVEIEVEEYRAWTASLLGEVLATRQMPAGGGAGEYALKGRTTLIEFILDHGGATAEANLSAVQLIRDGQPTTLDLSAALLKGHVGNNPVLDDGDVVYLPPHSVGGGRIFVLGEVANPGAFRFHEGLTVMDALAMAGSFTKDADPKKTYVARHDATGAKAKLLPVDVQAILAQGDFGRDLRLNARDLIVVERKGGVGKFLEKIFPALRTLVEIAILVQLVR